MVEFTSLLALRIEVKSISAEMEQRRSSKRDWDHPVSHLDDSSKSSFAEKL